MTLWSVACQTPLSVEVSRQEYWSGLPFPSPGDLPDTGTEPRFLALQADSLPSETPGKSSCFPIFLMLHIRSPGPINSTSYKSFTCRHTSLPLPLFRSPGPVNSTSYKSFTCRHTSLPLPLFRSLYLIRTSVSPSPPTFHTLEATPPKLLLRYSPSDFSVFLL